MDTGVVMTMIERAFAGIFRVINRFVAWYRLWTPLSVANLVALRIDLRRWNLYATETEPPEPLQPLVIAPGEVDHRMARTADGSWNDLASPRMGMAETRFGRNVPVERTRPYNILDPSPREISRALMTRHDFIPATTLNLLAAAWIQFMIHDWFSHGPNERENPHILPLAPDDPWPQSPMRVLRSHVDTTRTPQETLRPPTFLNAETHWWDASQIYGTSMAVQNRVRAHADGKLALLPNGLLPLDPEGIDISGVTGNWWIGLSLLHTLFTLEHNAVCDRLRQSYPNWTDGQLFARARLVVAALTAKIHTVEWTPALLDTPALRFGMRGNWWGMLGERFYRRYGRLGRSEIISGIPGSPTNHHTAPYSITEEFVSVYRMHPLMPDDFLFRSVVDHAEILPTDLEGVAGAGARRTIDRVGIVNAFYSFGVAHPGAIVLNNYPRHLQNLKSSSGEVVKDLATIDILRDRERGVPRYNDFRELLRMPRISSFEALNPRYAEALKAHYPTVDDIDNVVGMFAEQTPPGFAFSDTAFRIFILMASRRLKSDRFFTTDYRPEVYTPEGLRWIDDNDMTTVLLRHYPALAPSLAGNRNPFAPWRAVA